MKIGYDTICPICSGSNITHFSKYPGRFLDCNELVRCQGCKVTFAYELPSPDTLDDYYAGGNYSEQNKAEDANKFRDFSYKLSESRVKIIIKMSQVFDQIPDVIDIGAGNAIFGKVLQDLRIKSIYSIVEPDQLLTSSYGEYIAHWYKNLAEVKPKSYDLAVLNQVLEHVPNPVEFMTKCHSILRPGGTIYIDIPFEDYIFKPSVEPHVIFYSIESLKLLLKNIGFEVLFCNTVGMRHEQAKSFFSRKPSWKKIFNPWIYLNYWNRFFQKRSINYTIDTFGQFKADRYGGNRQWLRCIAKK